MGDVGNRSVCDVPYALGGLIIRGKNFTGLYGRQCDGLIAQGAAALLGLVLMGAPSLDAVEAPRLLVLDLKAEGMPQYEADSLTNLVIDTAGSGGTFRVLSRTEAREGVAAAANSGDCDSSECFLDAGAAVGADMVLSGSLLQRADSCTVTLNLYKVHIRSRDKRRHWRGSCGEEWLVKAVRGCTRELLGLEVRETREKRWSEPPPRKSGDSSLDFELTPLQKNGFSMGSYTAGDADERPMRLVQLSDFAIGRYEVTQSQWEQVMGANPSRFSGCPQCPVESVSWAQVQEFLRRASKMTGTALRLPTEAEWEYAARSGRGMNRWAGTDSEEGLREYGWYVMNSGGRTHPVGSRRANSQGLFDMSGNVAEWCSDWYGYYGSEGEEDPKGPPRGSLRVFRGGSWRSKAAELRVTARDKVAPFYGDFSIGFRVARDLP